MPLDWGRDGANWPNRALSRFPVTRGVRWHVQRGGAGPKLLLLHGAGAPTHSWRSLIPLLTPGFEILAPDLPGEGFSSGAAPRFTLPGMALDVAALLAEQAFAPDLVVGHSAGAAIALRLALAGGAAPRGIVCLNGPLTPFRGWLACSSRRSRNSVAQSAHRSGLRAHRRCPGRGAGIDHRNRQHDRPRGTAALRTPDHQQR